MTNCKVEKEGERPSKCKFKSICVFDGFIIRKDGKFLKVSSELKNVLVTRKNQPHVWKKNLRPKGIYNDICNY